jgi:hypothetical protein
MRAPIAPRPRKAILDIVLVLALVPVAPRLGPADAKANSVNDPILSNARRFAIGRPTRQEFTNSAVRARAISGIRYISSGIFARVDS